jgi:hypothetical protein
MTQPDACPCGLDAGLRHVNTRTAGDDRPDYAYCRHCGRPIQREPGATAWTAALIGVPGRDHQCRQAPNPDDGPMPGHEPRDVVVHPPTL